LFSAAVAEDGSEIRIPIAAVALRILEIDVEVRAACGFRAAMSANGSGASRLNWGRVSHFDPKADVPCVIV
jgi:hypothetical protein